MLVFRGLTTAFRMVPGSVLFDIMETKGKGDGNAGTKGSMEGGARMAAGASGDEAGAGAGGRENNANDVMMAVVCGSK